MASLKLKAALGLIALVATACGASERITPTPEGGQIIERSGRPDIVVANVRAPSHEEAVAEARATFDYFLAMQAADAPGHRLFSAKVGLPTTDDSLEHIWLIEVERSGDRFTGILNNDPYDLADDLKIGDRVSFTREQLTDWGYSENGLQRGHFTTRILALQMPEADRVKVMSMLHELPLPKAEGLRN